MQGDGDLAQLIQTGCYLTSGASSIIFDTYDVHRNLFHFSLPYSFSSSCTSRCLEFKDSFIMKIGLAVPRTSPDIWAITVTSKLVFANHPNSISQPPDCLHLLQSSLDIQHDEQLLCLLPQK